MSRVSDIRTVQGGASLMVAWRLSGKTVLVVGGGKVAEGRVLRALESDARVIVVAEILAASLRHRWTKGEITWRPSTWHPDDLNGVDMVLSCIDDPDVSAQIAAESRARGIPVNCADIPDDCDFWFTSVHREGPVQISVSSNGQGPALGARVLRELRDALPKDLETAVTRFGELRKVIRAVTPAASASPRRMGWLTRLARAWSWQDLAALDEGGIQALATAYEAGEPPPEDPRPRRTRTTPRVRLVGAGPGDPDLLTHAARQAIQEADLVLSDRLVPPAILSLVRGELRVARKFPGRADEAQAELHRWALEGVHAGRDVVRLKCGDPFIFGRGGEEHRFFADHGIAAEVIPGVTSALSAPLLAGIPTTMRGLADRVVIATARGQANTTPSPHPFDGQTTYIWLMGVRRLPDLFAELEAHGFPADWPAAIVERASHPDQRMVRGCIHDLPKRAAAAGIAAPATIIVGRVVEALAAQESAPQSTRMAV